MSLQLILSDAVDALKRIAAAGERIAASLEQGNDAEPFCSHPQDARVDHSTMGHQRWVCDEGKGGCGFSVGMEA